MTLNLENIILHCNSEFVNDKLFVLNQSIDVRKKMVKNNSFGDMLDFDWKRYLNDYQDLTLAGIVSNNQAYTHYIVHGIKENRIGFCVKPNPPILIVMPTYNRSQNIELRINMMKLQTLKNWAFLIIDDGSNVEHKLIFNKLKEKYASNSKIVFLENETNCNVAKTLNRGVQCFLNNSLFMHFTWISDDNEYSAIYLEKLQHNNRWFSYSSYNIKKLNKITDCNQRSYTNLNDLLKNFNGCASFMWSKSAIEKIGFYNEDINGCEDFEYLLRTFKLQPYMCNYVNISLMTYIVHDDSGMEKNKTEIMLLKNTIVEKFNHELTAPLENVIIKDLAINTIGMNLCNKNDNNKDQICEQDINPNNSQETFNFPRLMHLYWDGNPLSFLNYMTILSFNKYHKNWKIIIYLPKIKTHTISWKGRENKLQYNEKCYLNDALRIRNVWVKYVDLNTIGFYNHASEVVKSDYFRYYILQKYGGLWSDFDIIFTGSIEEKMNFNNNAIIFNCTGYHNLKNKLTSPKFIYYPIGLLMSKPESLFFKFVMNHCKKYYNDTEYQSIGASMFNDLFKTPDDVYKIDENVKILDHTYYLPWQCNELSEFLEKSDNILPITNVGIHWFNGATDSKQYAIDIASRIHCLKPKCYLDKYVQKYLNRRIALFSESSYPGGGGEEFLMDVAVYFTNNGYDVYWISLHDWGKPIHNKYEIINKQNYVEIRVNRKITDNANFSYFNSLLIEFGIDYLLSQGAGHKLICDLGFGLNIPTITLWSFWEEAIDINWTYGLLDINDNLDKHQKNDNFRYIINNIDHYYFASKFVKTIVEKKYNIQISSDHVLPTFSNNTRFLKDVGIDSFNSEYISLLDVHTLKGGVIMAELIKMNPKLSFLGIKTEDENGGPDAITTAMEIVGNKRNILHMERVENISDVYNKTKILLCPTYLDETFCRVVFEAFANKIPVIFSNKGNLKYISNNELLRIDTLDPKLYNNTIQKLITNKTYYQSIVDKQYTYFMKVNHEGELKILEDRFLKIETDKNLNIGIFTPWCDQGLGIQGRIYKTLLEEMGYKVYIFSTKPYISTNVNNLIGNESEWCSNNVYKSPNRRLDVSNLEWELFIKNYRIKKLIIPEVQYQQIFDLANLMKTYKIKTYAIPNIECARDIELDKYDVFDHVFANNHMTYDILKSHNFRNLSYLGFNYAVANTLSIKSISTTKQIGNHIEILHLSGLNGLFRKRTDVIVNIFNEIYNRGTVNFTLNIVIQGNFDIKRYEMFDKPFIKVIKSHVSYSEIMNLYNSVHISIQISKQEGLGLGFYESCFMNTPVITLDAPPHNEIIHHNKNGWLLSCHVKKDEKPENPFTIIGQTQIDPIIIGSEIESIIKNVDNINEIIKNTKIYTSQIHSYKSFKDNIMSVFDQS